jgi:plastocyanin
MRNFWVAIIGVILFAGVSFATAPVVQDIPDIKLLTGSGQVNDFDLSAYVTDYDDDPASLTYAIDSDTTGNASIAGSLVDIAGSATVAEGLITYSATDGTPETDTGTQVVKYSSLSLVGPSLTEDRNLTPATDALPRTWVIVADEVLTTAGIKAMVTGGTPDGMSVAIADLDGNNLVAAGATAETGDLSAAIDSDGVLTLQAPAGSYPITEGTQLSGAYRVGVKASLSGGVGDNWDGLELLVSTAMFPNPLDANPVDELSAERYEQFCGFEDVPTGALVGGSAMRALADADSPRWSLGAGTGEAAIVDTGIPTSTWATGGTQALKVTLDAGEYVFIQSEMFTDIMPGDTVSFAANVYTNATESDADTVPGITFFMGNFHSPSNYQGVVLAKGGNATPLEQVPLQEWRTIKTAFEADTVGANLTVTEGSFNIYEKGYQAAISISAPATGVGEIYIDNVRVYKDKNDIDKALASPKIMVGERDTPAELLDGTFESGNTLADYGILRAGAQTGTVAIDTNVANNAPTHEGTNSLKITAGSGSEFAYLVGSLNAEDAGGDNNQLVDIGDIIGASVWFKTDAATLQQAPGVMFFLGDAFYKNVPFADVGGAGCPLVGWKKVTISSAMIDVNRVVFAAIVRNAATPSRAYFPQSLKDNLIGSDCADTAVYVDDLEFYRVPDDSMYYDDSVF